MILKKYRLLNMTSALALLIFCGCGGGAGSDSLTAGGGIGGSGVTVGSVSKFGSVFVNGVEFDTTGAVVVVDGIDKGIGDQDVVVNLAVGKVVRVEGPLNNDGTGTADRIVYNAEVLGPVDSITEVDVNIRKLIVMGQTVIADQQTSFRNTMLDSLAASNFLEVSGFVDDESIIHATYIEKKADSYTSGDEVQVRGRASNVDPLLKTFKINQLTVDYFTVDVSSLSNGAPQNGQLLEVKGALGAVGVLAATRVAPETILGVENADNAKISGIVTAVASPTELEVSGIPVLTDPATEYKGILQEDLAAGSYVLVKGSVAEGVILADTIQSNAPVKIEANVESKTPSDLPPTDLTLAGLKGITVTVNELTKILGEAATIIEIAPGDHVKIFGKSFTSESVTADKLIVKKNPSSNVELKGPVVEVLWPEVKVLDVGIDTSGIPEEGFFLEDGQPPNRAQFQDRVSIGDTVSARGELAASAVKWQAVELEEND